MSYKKPVIGVAQYVKGGGREAELATATPHRLIQILMETLQGNLAAGKGALERKDRPLATQTLTRALAIISELRMSIDFEKGGEPMQTLDSLYDFMGRHVSAARSGEDPKMVQEVIDTFRPIKEGWDEIKDEANKIRPTADTE